MYAILKVPCSSSQLTKTVTEKASLQCSLGWFESFLVMYLGIVIILPSLLGQNSIIHLSMFKV